MSTNFENKITSIEQKIIVLKNKYLQAKNTAEKYETENKILKLEVEKLSEQIKDFQNQEKITKIAQSILNGSEDTAELKLKIGEYIKELDKCIAHLSN